jgi:hypothetical protein
MYGEPWQVYPTLTIDIAYISSITPQFGDVDVAVAGYAKAWTFHGDHLQDGDQVTHIHYSEYSVNTVYRVTCFIRVLKLIARCIVPSARATVSAQ